MRFSFGCSVAKDLTVSHRINVLPEPILQRYLHRVKLEGLFLIFSSFIYFKNGATGSATVMTSTGAFIHLPKHQASCTGDIKMKIIMAASLSHGIAEEKRTGKENSNAAGNYD